jgi:hypothetical protein
MDAVPNPVCCFASGFNAWLGSINLLPAPVSLSAGGVVYGPLASKADVSSIVPLVRLPWDIASTTFVLDRDANFLLAAQIADVCGVVRREFGRDVRLSPVLKRKADAVIDRLWSGTLLEVTSGIVKVDDDNIGSVQDAHLLSGLYCLIRASEGDTVNAVYHLCRSADLFARRGMPAASAAICELAGRLKGGVRRDTSFLVSREAAAVANRNHSAAAAEMWLQAAGGLLSEPQSRRLAINRGSVFAYDAEDFDRLALFFEQSAAMAAGEGGTADDYVRGAWARVMSQRKAKKSGSDDWIALASALDEAAGAVDGLGNTALAAGLSEQAGRARQNARGSKPA